MAMTINLSPKVAEQFGLKDGDTIPKDLYYQVIKRNATEFQRIIKDEIKNLDVER